MKTIRTLSSAILVLDLSVTLASAQLLYEQTFNPTNEPLGYAGTIEDSGWVVEPLAYQGTYNTNYGTIGLYDADTNQPVNGNTGVFIGTGGPVTQSRGMFYTTAGSGGFDLIDPAAYDRLLFTVYANTQGGGAYDVGYFAVQLGDGDPRTDDEVWYISSSPMATPTVNEGNTMNLGHLVYDDSPGAWRELALGPPTPGALAGDLSGLLISGVGIVQEITNGDGDFSSWNYADYRIFAVPEPATIAILVGAAVACFLRRSRKR
jgi:hypothetical protein